VRLNAVSATTTRSGKRQSASVLLKDNHPDLRASAVF
jgi:hypothetical protein